MERRRIFRDQLTQIKNLEAEALNLAGCQLSRAVDSLVYQDVELAEIVIAGDAEVDVLYRRIHHDSLHLLGQESPQAGDLRFLTSALAISRCIERIGDQCVNIAKLIPLGFESPTDGTTIETLKYMGSLAHAELRAAQEALAEGTPLRPDALTPRRTEVNRLDRKVFTRCTEISVNGDIREWAMFMVLAARAVQRTSENAVEIARQLTFVETGTFVTADV